MATPEEQPETREDGVHDRSRLTWVVTAALVAVIVGLVAWAVTDSDSDDEPSADVSSSGASVTQLQAGEPTGSRCAPPSAELLAGNDVAFDGVVETISGDIVTLRPSRWYAGDPTDLVTVAAPGGQLDQLLASVTFEEDERYLVAGSDGRIALCLLSAPYSRALEGLYERAFTQ